MRAAAIAILLAAVACSGGNGALSAQYAPLPPPVGWCRMSPGVYAFEWVPSTSPDLVGLRCIGGTPAGDVAPPAGTTVPVTPAPSTLAELVIAPGAAVELPIELPPGLFGMGCELDRVVIAHGLAEADPAIDLRAGDTVVPIVDYAGSKFPPADDIPGVTGRVGDDLRNRPPAPTPPPDGGGTGGTGAGGGGGGGSVEVGLSVLGWSAGVRLEFGNDAGAVRQLAPPAAVPLALFAVQHAIHAPAPDRFAVIVRAGAKPLSLGVRLDTEAPGYRPLAYRAPGATAAVPTHMIPQAAIVLSHCRRSADAVLGAIAR